MGPRSASHAPHRDLDLVWSPCGYCWGQARVYEQVEAPNGEGRVLRAESCPRCLGTGSTLSASRATPARRSPERSALGKELGAPRRT